MRCHFVWLKSSSHKNLSHTLKEMEKKKTHFLAILSNV